MTAAQSSCADRTRECEFRTREIPEAAAARPVRPARRYATRMTPSNCVSRSQPSVTRTRSSMRTLLPRPGCRSPAPETTFLLRGRRSTRAPAASAPRGSAAPLTHPVPVRPPEALRLDQRPEAASASLPCAGSDRREPGELRLETERIQLGEPLWCHRPRRSGAVRAVAVEDAARVDDDEHARLDRRVAGNGVREAAVAPAPTTASKETPSAPPSRKLRSIHHASSRSLRPLNRSRASAANTSSDSALARRMHAISSSSLTARSVSTTGDRNRVDPRIRERAEERVREMLLLDQDPPPAQELADRGNEPRAVSTTSAPSSARARFA